MTVPNESITMVTRWDGAAAHVQLAGELDMHSSAVLAAEIAELLEGSPTSIGIDASGVTFADSAGLRALLLARDDAEARKASLSLTQVSEALGRMLDMTGLREALSVPAA